MGDGVGDSILRLDDTYCSLPRHKTGNAIPEEIRQRNDRTPSDPETRAVKILLFNEIR